MKLMMMTLLITLLSACMPISGGSGSNSMEQYSQAVESWQGANINELLAAWPRSWLKDQTPMADGSTIVGFIWTEEYYRQAEQYYDHAHNEWVDKTPAGTELLICETRFVTDSQGLITAVKPGSHHCGLAAIPPARSRSN